MRPDDDSLLVDMLVAAREAQALCRGVTLEEFLLDRVLQLALQKLVENIGEAASRLLPQTRAKLPELPWKDMVGMRNRLVHNYMHVNLSKVWHVVDEDLQPLIAAIEPLVPPEESDEPEK
jgi:uncharacterized protein with HEPN domain